jgi:hypothetical protein
MTEEERLYALRSLDFAVRMPALADPEITQERYYEALLETYLFHKEEFPVFIDAREVAADSEGRAEFLKKVAVDQPPEWVFVELDVFEYRRGDHSLAYGVAGFNMAERLFAIGRAD